MACLFFIESRTCHIVKADPFPNLFFNIIEDIKECKNFYLAWIISLQNR